MCIGVPLQVLHAGEGWAVCVDGDATRRVDTRLLDATGAGDWLLIHVDRAVRRIEPIEARQIRDALLAVQNAAAGRPFEHLLADLIDREPELPPHLRPGGA
jgi:hydrogenase expression/formation protein HypC